LAWCIFNTTTNSKSLDPSNASIKEKELLVCNSYVKCA
jgi:hypothetical protein